MVSLVETHVSTLFFVGDRVFKSKKPVDNGFLDFTTSASRRAACHREVELNRRLAPDVYLGVAELTMHGEELEHFVVMRQLPDARRLSALLDEPGTAAELDRIAGVLARFHRHAERGPHVDRASSAAALQELWRTGREQLTPFLGEVLDEREADRMAALATEYLSGRGVLVDERIEAGRACDGHGDLQAEDIFCLEDGPRLLDCLEFDDDLRYGDVLADVAFLAMDLERLGHPELATQFLERYRSDSGDRWPGSLAHLHIAYRAHVRSKVMCLRHQQGDRRAATSARSFHTLALAHLEQARVRLVLVGGAPGTGKTTVARDLAASLGAVRISTDDLRGEVLTDDAGPAGTLHEGRYAPEYVAAVYDELLRRARSLLERGERVVLDASWSRRAQRAAARELAGATSAALTELSCWCPPDVAASRIGARSAAGSDTSEVTADLGARLAEERDPWPESEVIDTDRDPHEVLVAASAAVNTTAS